MSKEAVYCLLKDKTSVVEYSLSHLYACAVTVYCFISMCTQTKR